MFNQKINLLLVFFFLYFSFGAFFPFNALYLEEGLGFNGNQIGIFYSISALSVMVSVPLIGIIADKVQNNKLVLVLTILFAVLFLVPYVMFKQFIILVITYTLIHSVRSSNGPLLDSFTIKYCNEKNLNYGIYRSFGAFAFIIGSILTGYFVTRYSDNKQLFIQIHIITLLLAAIFLVFQDNVNINLTRKINIKKDIHTLLNNKQFILVLFIMALAYAITQVAQTYLSLSIKDLGGSSDIVGLSFLFLVIPEVLFFSLAIKLARKYSHHKIMLIGVISSILRFSILLFTSSMVVFLIVSSSHGLVMAFIIIVGMDLISKIVDKELLSSAITLFTGISSLLFSVISLIVGNIMESYSIKASNYLYLFLALIVLLLVYLYNRKYQGVLSNGN